MSQGNLLLLKIVLKVLSSTKRQDRDINIAGGGDIKITISWLYLESGKWQATQLIYKNQ